MIRSPEIVVVRAPEDVAIVTIEQQNLVILSAAAWLGKLNTSIVFKAAQWPAAAHAKPKKKTKDLRLKRWKRDPLTSNPWRLRLCIPIWR